MKEEFEQMRAKTKNWDESVLDRTDAHLLNDIAENDETPVPVAEGMKDDQTDLVLAEESFY